MTDFQSSVDSQPIESVDQLVGEIHAAAKPRAAWRIGTEYEKLAVDPGSGRAAPFSGPAGIEAVLRGLADDFGWAPKEEAGRVVALRRGHTSMTLEPGGQVELAGEVCETLHCTRKELVGHVEELAAVARRLGVAFLGLGIQPVSSPAEIELVPKERYGIMAPYMGRVGTLGLRMMKQTATVQTNIDFDGEADAMRKIRVGNRLAPVLNAIFANSCVLEGRLTRHKSFRGHVWTDTDPARCGLLPLAFEDGGGFDAYVQWALDVPMYFVVRDGRYRTAVTGMPFRRYLAEGAEGERATLDDWHLHLTTLFPEVRLKTYIEFRSADAPPPRLVLALPALVKGLYYEPDCLDAAWDVVKTWSFDTCREALDDASRLALQGRLGRHAIAEWAREIGRIAFEGLRRQGALDAGGRDESVYLEPLLELVEAGRTPADDTIEHWGGSWHGEVGPLLAQAAITGPAEIP
jgi:glutamate--cysteine ligase